MLVVTGSFTATLVLPLLGVRVDTSIAITITLPLPLPSSPSPLPLPSPSLPATSPSPSSSPSYTCRHGRRRCHCHHHLSQPIDCRIFIAFLLSVQCFFLCHRGLCRRYFCLLSAALLRLQLVFFPLKNCCKATQRIPFTSPVPQYHASTCRTLYPTKVDMICITTFVVLMGTPGYIKMICVISNL